MISPSTIETSYINQQECLRFLPLHELSLIAVTGHALYLPHLYKDNVSLVYKELDRDLSNDEDLALK